MFSLPFAQHIRSEVFGDFTRLMTLIVTGVHDAPGTINPDWAKEHAEKLYNAGKAKLGIDEEVKVFNKIIAHDSFAQLRLVFEEYKNLTGKTIEQALNSEIGKGLLKGMLAIVECVQSPPTFFER